MRKKALVILTVVVGVLVVLFIGASSFIGLQVFSASTQLVTNEETKEVLASFWEKHDMSFESFRNTYRVEKLEIISSFDEHIIPADYIYAEESQNSKNNQTILLVHGLGDNRYSNYPLAEYFLRLGSYVTILSMKINTYTSTG